VPRDRSAPFTQGEFPLDRTYAAGEQYKPLVRELEAAGRIGLNRALNQEQINALLQNIRDVLTHSYHSAIAGRPRCVLALNRQARLGRWRYLNQLPPAAQAAFHTALGSFGIKIPLGR